MDPNTLITELAEWNNGEGIDIDSWISCVGSFEHAIAYGRMFWPEFVEHDGCILRAGFNVESYDGFMQRCEGDRTAIEKVMNHWHICDLFGGADQEPTGDQVVYLGRALKDMWQCKLDREFPGADMIVLFGEEGCDDLLDYEITFYQSRKTDNKSLNPGREDAAG